MVAYLIERGVDLDESDESGVTALEAALEYARWAEIDDPAVLTALHAADVLITMGARVWKRPGFNYRTYYDVLGRCVERAVLSHCGRVCCEDLEERKALYREIQKGWGQLVKTIVRKANVSTSQDISTAERTAIGECTAAAFERLSRGDSVKYAPYHDYHGPWAVGKLLLSTGITPSDEAIERWKAITLRRSWEGLEADGDRSQWQFLLQGIQRRVRVRVCTCGPQLLVTFTGLLAPELSGLKTSHPLT